MKHTFWTLFIVAITFSAFTAGFLLSRNDQGILSPAILYSKKEDEKPLEKYTIPNLTSVSILPGNIEIGELIENDNDDYESFVFELQFNPNLDGKTKSITTGQINVPAGDQKYPIVIMLRGYIDQELYKTGDGTRNASGVLSENGFITVAPDFLGYGGSDSESADIFETRFQTYVTVLSLIESLNQISAWDAENLFMWGHSNGGQIAVTILETMSKNIPTTLWAPVTKQFPYSILYYTDNSVDGGKLIRRELAKFEENYDTDMYSLTKYIENINSPLQVHQGAIDDAVPVSWTDEFVDKLNDLEKDVTYHKYPGVDHNMRPIWDKVVERDLEFFNSFIN